MSMLSESLIRFLVSYQCPSIHRQNPDRTTTRLNTSVCKVQVLTRPLKDHLPCMFRVKVPNIRLSGRYYIGGVEVVVVVLTSIWRTLGTRGEVLLLLWTGLEIPSTIFASRLTLDPKRSHVEKERYFVFTGYPSSLREMVRPLFTVIDLTHHYPLPRPCCGLQFFKCPLQFNLVLHIQACQT